MDLGIISEQIRQVKLSFDRFSGGTRFLILIGSIFVIFASWRTFYEKGSYDSGTLERYLRLNQILLEEINQIELDIKNGVLIKTVKPKISIGNRSIEYVVGELNQIVQEIDDFRVEKIYVHRSSKDVKNSKILALQIRGGFFPLLNFMNQVVNSSKFSVEVTEVNFSTKGYQYPEASIHLFLKIVESG